jgi:FkbH-like protein
VIIETEFSDEKSNINLPKEIKYPFYSSINNKRLLILWREHCHECAPPLCYSNCKNFLRRADNKCQLISNGIRRVSISKDIHFNLKFRKWAKIESQGSSIVVKSYIDIFLSWMNLVVITVIKLIFFRSIKIKILNLFIMFKEWGFRNFKLGKINKPLIDFSLYSDESEEFNIIVESKNYKRKILVQPGPNSYLFSIPENIVNELIKWFPENDRLVNIFLKNFNIVENCYDSVLNTMPKLIIWDLDNTLWKGVLVESKIEDLILRKDLVWTIKYLDSIGVVSSICSKNDYENAKEVLEFFNLWQYFVFPEINWDSKSNNIRKILNNINLGEKNVIVVDDNPFERAEISSVIKDINVFDENIFPDLLMDNHFINLKYNSESSNRRHLYKTEQKRVTILDHTISEGNTIHDFLKSCNICVDLNFLEKKDLNSTVLTRCHELMARTNQLNVSGAKFNDNEFNDLINDKSDKFYFKVSDSFGSYGIVGFLNCIVNDREMIIHNLVISCRVAKKLIENTVINGLTNYYLDKNIKNLSIDYKKTSRNTPIFESFIDMGFNLEKNGNLNCNLSDLNDTRSIIKIEINNGNS